MAGSNNSRTAGDKRLRKPSSDSPKAPEERSSTATMPLPKRRSTSKNQEITFSIRSRVFAWATRRATGRMMRWTPSVTALPSRLETRRAFKAQIAAALPILRPFQRQLQHEQLFGAFISRHTAVLHRSLAGNRRYGSLANIKRHAAHVGGHANRSPPSTNRVSVNRFRILKIRDWRHGAKSRQ
jgi:hypothetical protein